MQESSEPALSQESSTPYSYLISGTTPETLRQMEMGAIYAHIRELRRQENRKLLLLSLVRLWPIAVGLCFACIAPQLRALVLPYKPWGMWIFFPFVALARRPELQFDSQLSRMLPMIMLYAQFPLEGLFARIALKKQVTLSGVARNIFFTHFLSAVELCLVSGVLWQITVR